MIRHNLSDFKLGWVVGDFSPALLQNKDIEIAIKKYSAGDLESRHVHKVATEYTIIVSGNVIMNGVSYSENDVIEIAPGESTDFYCLDDTITVVIKSPSVIGDKFTISE